jgi:cysteine-rich repeat protein
MRVAPADGVRRPGLLAAAFATLAVTPLAAPAAGAERLLTPVAAGRAPGAPLLRGVAHVERLALGRRALADLRGRSAATVSDFPLGADRTADLVLTRFEPFAPETRVEVMEAGGARRLALPDNVYFAGTVRGDPASRVVLVAAPDAVHGFVVADGTVYPFGPAGAHGHRSYALRDADPATYPPPGDFCAVDLHPRTKETPGAHARALAEAGLLSPPVAPVPGVLRQAEVAIETDRELRLKFATDQAALDYLASLAAAASAIYERDLGVRLLFSYVRLWGASPADPWTSSDTVDALDEVQAYWTDPANDMDTIAGPRDIVHFLSGKAVQGGVAYVDALCDQSFGFGVSQVFGSFDLADPSEIWDILVVTHEIGHNFGSRHTHCYTPPVDQCYNAEPSCYSGPVVVSRGTIMSYCHLLSGVANIDLVFGDVVSARIGTSVADASCLATVQAGACGDGVKEGSEQCDDGNTVGGDGCSPTCAVEGCGNGVVDVGEGCDDGNTAGADGCSAACQPEPFCGDGTVDAGEECDDGNAASGDGCTQACAKEACVVLKSAQTVWPVARFILRRPGTAKERLLIRGDFGLPLAVGALTPTTSGVRVMVETASGARALDLTVPGGAGWVSRSNRWLYRDRSGSIAGIRKLVIRDMTIGGVPDVHVVIQGRAGGYKIASGDLPVVMTLVLGDAAAGQAGACGRFAFGGGSCASVGGSARIVCR